MSHVEVTDSNFEEEVLKSDKVVLVDFWASWCMPCQMLSPVIEEIDSEMSGKVKVCKLEVDGNKETAAKYNIMSIPAVYIFKDGKVVDQLVGLRQKSEYVTILNKYLQD